MRDDFLVLSLFSDASLQLTTWPGLALKNVVHWFVLPGEIIRSEFVEKGIAVNNYSSIAHRSSGYFTLVGMKVIFFPLKVGSDGFL